MPKAKKRKPRIDWTRVWREFDDWIVGKHEQFTIARTKREKIRALVGAELRRAS